MMGPPWSSVHQGLEFAFANVAGCGSNWPNQVAVRATRGMSRADMVAQAGMVRAVVSRLENDQSNWVGLSYSPAAEATRCARSLAGVVSARAGVETPVQLASDLVLWVSGRRDVRGVTARRIAQRNDVSVHRVLSAGEKIGEQVRIIGLNAFCALDCDFRSHGWIVE